MPRADRRKKSKQKALEKAASNTMKLTTLLSKTNKNEIEVTETTKEAPVLLDDDDSNAPITKIAQSGSLCESESIPPFLEEATAFPKEEVSTKKLDDSTKIDLREETQGEKKTPASFVILSTATKDEEITVKPKHSEFRFSKPVSLMHKIKSIPGDVAKGNQANERQTTDTPSEKCNGVCCMEDVYRPTQAETGHLHKAGDRQRK